jgi:endonuclease-3
VAEGEIDAHSLRAILERAVPKNRGAEFADLLEELAHDTCVEGVPDCPRCELRKICPTGRARKDEAHSPKAVAAKAAKDGVKPAPSTKTVSAKGNPPPAKTPKRKPGGSK